MTQRFILAFLLASLPAMGMAQERAAAPERPEVLNRLTACRAIGDAGERLACFDREVAALEAAEAAREIAVVDRQQIRRTRRSLFGLRLPDLGIFGDDDDRGEDGAGVQEITSTLRSAYTGNDGRMQYALEDNSVWVQTEGRVGRMPRGGEAVRVRRGLLGSFILTIGERAGVRVVRVR